MAAHTLEYCIFLLPGVNVVTTHAHITTPLDVCVFPSFVCVSLRVLMLRVDTFGPHLCVQFYMCVRMCVSQCDNGKAVPGTTLAVRFCVFARVCVCLVGSHVVG